MQPFSNGYWETRGVPALVDWCEPNYVHSVYVAEWWNTTSSGVLALAGMVGWWLCRRRATDRRFSVAFATLAMVGLGSVAFHGTLLRYPQAADELPMVFLSLICVYILRFRQAPPEASEGTRRRRWGLALGAYGLAFAVAYFVIPSSFVFFLISYSVVVAFVVVQTWHLVFQRRPYLKRLFYTAFGCYLGGFVLFWVPEHLLLPCDHPLQSLQLHAWFHVTSAVGTYAWILLLLYDRMESRGERPLLNGLPPFVGTLNGGRLLASEASEPG